MTQRERRIDGLRELWALIREDYKANTRSIFSPGFQALAVHRFGVWKHPIRSRILRAPLSVLYRAMNLVVRNLYGIELDIGTHVGRRVQIAHQHGIVIHPLARIGDDCLLRQGVSIGQGFHPTGSVQPGAPKIGNRVLIGAGAIIAGAIEVGDDAVIGPNAVVMTNVPPNSIASVPPARIMPRPPRRKPAGTPAPASPPAALLLPESTP